MSKEILVNGNLVVSCILVKKTSSKYDDISDKNTEEDIYPEGGPFEGYLYPNNTWDSNDPMYELDYSSKTGWI